MGLVGQIGASSGTASVQTLLVIYQGDQPISPSKQKWCIPVLYHPPNVCLHSDGGVPVAPSQIMLSSMS